MNCSVNIEKGCPLRNGGYVRCRTLDVLEIAVILSLSATESFIGILAIN